MVFLIEKLFMAAAIIDYSNLEKVVFELTREMISLKQEL